MTIQDLTDITSFKWATITGVSPLAIQLDGDTAPLALIPDTLVDPLELLVGDRVRVELSIRKCVIHGAANGGGQSGEVKVTAAATAPRGWLLAQGQSLLRSTYPRLFAAIGTAYGAVDSTHFTLPDMRGKVAVGLDTTQTEFNALGKTGGEKAHALSVAELASHQHNQTVAGPSGGGTGYAPQALSNWGGAVSSSLLTGAAGSGTAHNNLQPYVTMNYIIKI